MRLLSCLLPLAALACASGGSDDEVDEDGGGVITFTVDGTEYTESKVVNASLQPGFLIIGWNTTAGGDLGEDFYGSLTLSAYDGPDSYAPVKRMSDVDAIIGVGIDGGERTYYPLGANGTGTAGDGSIEVASADDAGAKGTFSFTGTVYNDASIIHPITGTFDVTFPTATEDDE